MEKPRRTQAARSKATRDQIVQSALTVFALKGYSASSMDDICLAAGCSKGGLYHHFRTKLAVLSGVVDRLGQTGGLLPPFAEGSLQHDAMGRVLIEIWAEAARDGALREQLRRCYGNELDRALQIDAGLSQVLRIGTLIQLLALTDGAAVEDAAFRLGISKAA